MAKPIEPTPPVSGEDARRLVEAMRDHASPMETERRRSIAREWMTQTVLPLLPSSLSPLPR